MRRALYTIHFLKLVWLITTIRFAKVTRSVPTIFKGSKKASHRSQVIHAGNTNDVKVYPVASMKAMDTRLTAVYIASNPSPVQITRGEAGWRDQSLYGESRVHGYNYISAQPVECRPARGRRTERCPA